MASPFGASVSEAFSDTDENPFYLFSPSERGGGGESPCGSSDSGGSGRAGMGAVRHLVGLDRQKRRTLDWLGGRTKDSAPHAHVEAKKAKMTGESSDAAEGSSDRGGGGRAGTAAVGRRTSPLAGRECDSPNVDAALLEAKKAKTEEARRHSTAKLPQIRGATPLDGRGSRSEATHVSGWEREAIIPLDDVPSPAPHGGWAPGALTRSFSPEQAQTATGQQDLERAERHVAAQEKQQRAAAAREGREQRRALRLMSVVYGVCPGDLPRPSPPPAKAPDRAKHSPRPRRLRTSGAYAVAAARARADAVAAAEHTVGVAEAAERVATARAEAVAVAHAANEKLRRAQSAVFGEAAAKAHARPLATMWIVG